MVVVPQAGHNDLFERGAWEKVRGFLESFSAGAGGAMAGPQMEIAAAATQRGSVTLSTSAISVMPALAGHPSHPSSRTAGVKTLDGPGQARP